MRFGKRARGVVRYGAILAIGYSQHLFIRDLQLYQVLGFLLAENNTLERCNTLHHILCFLSGLRMFGIGRTLCVAKRTGKYTIAS